jgi:RNA polymerase sigma factor (sigma-70 family)
MFNTALRILNHIPDAEDVLQEAFTDAFRQLKSFEQRSTFGAWLKQIVIFKSVSALKKRSIQLVEMDVDEGPADVEYTSDDCWYTVEMIREALQQLPDGYRTAVSLYLLEGYNHEEVAEQMGIAPSTARTQYTRGKEKLVEFLKQNKVYER